jgi:hypothetical protein
MKQTGFSKTLGDAWRIGNRLGELQRRRATFMDRGRGEWSADDEAELELLQREQHAEMARVARDTVLPHLDAYRRPACPVRPGTLPLDDERLEKDLRAAKKKAEDGHPNAKATKLAKKILAAWAEHKRAVQKAQAEGTSRVRALFAYQSHAEAAGDEETAERLGGFLAREWGHDGPFPDDIDAAATRLARRRDVISDRLMFGERPSSETNNGPRQMTAPELA